MSTCRTCIHWTPQDTVLEREDQPGHFYALGSCVHDLVYVAALDNDEAPGEYMVLTTEDASCLYHKERP